MDQAKKKKKKRDPLRNLKYLGYKNAVLPDTYNLDELVTFAKFQLASKSRRLLKDPIWDEYTKEELLIEFYGHQFLDNEKFRTAFEMEMGTGDDIVDAFSAWADKEIQKEAKIRDRVMGETEDSLSFSPDDVMGEE